MGLLIDSSVLIAAERGRIDLGAFAERHAAEVLVLSAISASELLHGAHRAQTAEQALQRTAFVEYLLAALTVVPFDLAAARRHAELWALLQARGQLIGSHDLLIAATALAHEFAMVTLNEAEFRRVPGLVVVNPATG